MMRKLVTIGILCLSSLTFAVSFAVHFSTYKPLEIVEQAPTYLFYLMLGFTILLCLISGLILRDLYGKKMGEWHNLPRWLTVLWTVFSGYVMIVFFVFIVLSPFMTKGEVHGKYYGRHMKGKAFEVTREEYFSVLRGEVRSFSGLWMLFCAMPMIGSGNFLAHPTKEHKRKSKKRPTSP